MRGANRFYGIMPQVQSLSVSVRFGLLNNAEYKRSANVSSHESDRTSCRSPERRFLDAMSKRIAIAIMSMVMLLVFLVLVSSILSFMHLKRFYIQSVSSYVFH